MQKQYYLRSGILNVLAMITALSIAARSVGAISSAMPILSVPSINTYNSGRGLCS